MKDTLLDYVKDVISWGEVTLKVLLPTGQVVCLNNEEIDSYLVKVLSGRLEPFTVLEVL